MEDKMEMAGDPTQEALATGLEEALVG